MHTHTHLKGKEQRKNKCSKNRRVQSLWSEETCLKLSQAEENVKAILIISTAGPSSGERLWPPHMLKSVMALEHCLQLQLQPRLTTVPGRTSPQNLAPPDDSCTPLWNATLSHRACSRRPGVQAGLQSLGSGQPRQVVRGSHSSLRSKNQGRQGLTIWQAHKGLGRTREFYAEALAAGDKRRLTWESLWYRNKLHFYLALLVKPLQRWSESTWSPLELCPEHDLSASSRLSGAAHVPFFLKCILFLESMAHGTRFPSTSLARTQVYPMSSFSCTICWYIRHRRFFLNHPFPWVISSSPVAPILLMHQ